MPRPVTSQAARRLNAELGQRVAARRQALGLSSRQLEDALLLPAGAVGCIERGEKALDAGLIIALTEILEVPVGFFFDDLPSAMGAGAPLSRPAHLVAELSEFLDQFHGIEDEAERRQVLALVRSVAESGQY